LFARLPRISLRSCGLRSASTARAGLAEVLAAVHADAFAGHHGRAFDQKQRGDGDVVRPDRALEWELGLGAHGADRGDVGTMKFPRRSFLHLAAGAATTGLG